MAAIDPLIESKQFNAEKMEILDARMVPAFRRVAQHSYLHEVTILCAYPTT